MSICKGTVKNNVVILQEGTSLPDGAEVEVNLVEARIPQGDFFRLVREHPIPHYVGMDEIIQEDKREREERWDH